MSNVRKLIALEKKSITNSRSSIGAHLIISNAIVKNKRHIITWLRTVYTITENKDAS